MRRIDLIDPGRIVDVGPILRIGVSRRQPHLGLVRAVALLCATMAFAACGSDEEPPLTFEDELAELEGRTLTPVEVAERVETGEALCQMDDQLLDEIWQLLDDDQLDFQDIVIEHLCPERSVLYAGHTGRVVTEEAEGVETSTTRPTSTTTTTRRPSTTRPPSTSDSSGTESSTDTSETSQPTSTTTASTSTSRSTTSTTQAATSTLISR